MHNTEGPREWRGGAKRMTLQDGPMVVKGKERRGRPHSEGTVLSRVMRERRLHVYEVAHALNCSDRYVYRLLIRECPVPPLKINALCDLLDMDPDEIVDEKGVLLKEETT